MDITLDAKIVTPAPFQDERGFFWRHGTTSGFVKKWLKYHLFRITTQFRTRMEPFTEIIYKCSNFYHFASEGCVKFDDQEINIEWPLDFSKALVSEKDAAILKLSQIDNPFSMEYF